MFSKKSCYQPTWVGTKKILMNAKLYPPNKTLLNLVIGNHSASCGASGKLTKLGSCTQETNILNSPHWAATKEKMRKLNY